VAVVKRFKSKYALDPKNIRMKESDINFIYYCKSISDRKKQTKLEESKINQETIDQSLRNV
jgi:hypothetical protein